MRHELITTGSDLLNPEDRTGMFRLRYEVFREKLNWDVKTTADKQEVDEFDALPRVHYILARADGSIDACWRLLPTMGPNMLRDVFPQLLHDQPAPMGPEVWELSRFAIATERISAGESAANHQVGFGQLSVALMTEAARFARRHGIARYVTVTTVVIERMLRHQGLHIRRLGPPARIGFVLTVACYIEVDEKTLKAIGFQE